MHLKAASLTVTATLLAGCQLDYNIEITPEGETLHRETTVSSSIEPHEVSKLTAAFGDPERSTSGEGAPDAKTMLIFNGSVSGDGWSDGFGGRGVWETIDTPIGTAHTFLECIGGDTHIADDLAALQDGIDAVDTLIRRQLKHSMQGDKMLPKVLNLLRQRVVPDAKDLAVAAWAIAYAQQALPEKDILGTDPSQGRLGEFFERRLQEAAVAFLWQRDWITADEASMLAAERSDLNDIYDRILARALGMKLTGDWQAQLEAFQKRFDDAFPKGFDKQLTKTFTKAVGEHTRLAVGWAATTAFLTKRKVTVSLKSATEPVITNGTWNKALGAVQWKLATAPLAVGVTAPPLCWSATWAKPNATAQDSILGHVGIDGKDLAGFCLAWKICTPERQQAVRDVLNSFARARSGTDIKAEAIDLLGECMELMEQ